MVNPLFQLGARRQIGFSFEVWLQDQTLPVSCNGDDAARSGGLEGLGVFRGCSQTYIR